MLIYIAFIDQCTKKYVNKAEGQKKSSALFSYMDFVTIL